LPRNAQPGLPVLEAWLAALGGDDDLMVRVYLDAEISRLRKVLHLPPALSSEMIERRRIQTRERVRCYRQRQRVKGMTDRLPRLTPGAFAESSIAAICVRGYDRARRIWHDKVGTAAKYRNNLPELSSSETSPPNDGAVC
jgi:hypothetical protein